MAKGKVVQVIGTVWMSSSRRTNCRLFIMPLKSPVTAEKIVLEVQDHIGNNWVRCLSFAPPKVCSEAPRLSIPGAAIKVPVGKATLGRSVRCTGQASG